MKKILTAAVLTISVFTLINSREIPTEIETAVYEIDPGHTFVHFTVNRFDMVDVVSRFTDVSGRIEFDPDQPQHTTAEILVRTNSLESGFDKRDNAVKGPAFLDVKNYPEIQYVNKKLQQKGDQFVAHGELTIHGTTRSVEFPVTLKGPQKDPTGLTTIAIKGILEINRQDFGLKFDKKLPNGKPFIGNRVKIEINVLAVKQS